MKKKILILGGCGYLGSYLTEYFYNKFDISIIDTMYYGNPIESLNINFTQKDIRDLRKEDLHNFDVILLFAAVSSVPLCEAFPSRVVTDNIEVFINLCEWLLPEQKLIYASSACVYNGNDPAYEDSPIIPTDMLSHSKSFIDHINTSKYPTKFISGLRIGSVCGYSPNFRTDLASNSMTMSALKEGLIKVSNGENKRPITPLKCIACTIEQLVEGNFTIEDFPKVINVPSMNTTFLELGHTIEKIIPRSKVVEVGGPSTYSFRMLSKYKLMDYIPITEIFRNHINEIVEVYNENPKLIDSLVKTRNPQDSKGYR